MSSRFTIAICLLFVAVRLAHGQEQTLEQRLPLELIFADSIVPQDQHEMMLTTGGWYFRDDDIHDALLTQKIEWGISDSLQVSTFINPLRTSNPHDSSSTGFGDWEIGARYTWAKVGSPFTQIAVAFDAGFPTGNVSKGLGEGAYTVSPSLLASHQFGKYQVFSTTGVELVVGTRNDVGVDVPHHTVFSNNGISRRLGHGWAVGEISVSSNRWNGGNETQASLAPSYIWRLARRTELLLGIPVGLTSSTNQVGGVVKFTFELGGSTE
jgi:hypothetical protein